MADIVGLGVIAEGHFSAVVGDEVGNALVECGPCELIEIFERGAGLGVGFDFFLGL